MKEKISLLDTVNTGFETKEKNKPSCKDRKYLDDSDTSLSTGFELIEKPSVPETIPQVETGPELFPESVKDTIQSGFGPKNELHKECAKPKLVTYLIKEKYLAEFEAETEKALARNNLGVYSTKEVEAKLKSLSTTLSADFVTKSHLNDRLTLTMLEFTEKLNSIEYVDSTIKALADYSVPDSLFTL